MRQEIPDLRRAIRQCGEFSRRAAPSRQRLADALSRSLSAMKSNYAERARALVGIQFRPQGRSDDGLDCIGVILRTFALEAGAARQNYRLRGDHRAELEAGLLGQFRRIAL